MNTTGDEVQRIYREQNWDGFIPKGIRCKRCDKVLNEDGGHPGENYLGCATGLCDICMREGPYVVKTYRDGAMQISVPPACPSWRRDREKYMAYEGCPVCQGKGYTVRGSTWSTYNSACETCSTRYSNDRWRKWFWRTQDRLYRVADACFKEDCVRIGLSKRNRKKRGEPRTYTIVDPSGETGNEIYELRMKWLERWRVKNDRLEERAAARGVFA